MHRLAERIAEEGRACVLIVNKWDAVEDKASRLLLRHVASARAVQPGIHSDATYLHAAHDTTPAAGLPDAQGFACVRSV